MASSVPAARSAFVGVSGADRPSNLQGIGGRQVIDLTRHVLSPVLATIAQDAALDGRSASTPHLTTVGANWCDGKYTKWFTSPWMPSVKAKSLSVKIRGVQYYWKRLGESKDRFEKHIKSALDMLAQGEAGAQCQPKVCPPVLGAFLIPWPRPCRLIHARVIDWEEKEDYVDEIDQEKESWNQPFELSDDTISVWTHYDYKVSFECSC